MMANEYSKDSEDTGKKQLVHFSVGVSSLMKWTSILLLFASAFAVLWSIVFEFERSTATHCKVYNMLPTLSSAIGGYTPQRYVWRTAIALHSAQRLLIALTYYSFHTSMPVSKYQQLYSSLSVVNSALHIVEVLSLVGLSMISSTENGDVHEYLFISFMVSGLTYMLLTIILMTWSGRSHVSKQDTRSIRYKRRLFLLNIATFFISVYLYFRHNNRCEPGVYSAFAAFEYMVVLTNILYHATSCIDFQHFDVGVIRTDLVSQRKQL